MANVDPSLSGSEIILGTDEPRRGRTRLGIFGVSSDGTLQRLCEFYAMGGSGLNHRSAGFTVGDVLPDTQHAGKEIVAGGRNGAIRIYGFDHGGLSLIRRLNAFPDPPQTSAERLAAGHLLPNIAGDEIAVGDDGTRGDGNVRILDPESGMLLLEFAAFAAGEAPDGVELWAGDILPAYPGDELIVGQGAAGGQLRVFSFASGVPMQVAAVPTLQRSTTMLHQVGIGDPLPEIPGRMLAIAQSAPLLPIQLVRFDAASVPLVQSVAAPAGNGVVSAVELGH